MVPFHLAIQQLATKIADRQLHDYLGGGYGQAEHIDKQIETLEIVYGSDPKIEPMLYAAVKSEYDRLSAEHYSKHK